MQFNPGEPTGIVMQKVIFISNQIMRNNGIKTLYILSCSRDIHILLYRIDSKISKLCILGNNFMFSAWRT